ncbi:hypothetical protein QCA50_005957 [Cerrena zonata]|uniref:THUMP domain-containing protein n=1 Tax=Cerrena zonata TaxID=2478898 RepID=A0AAW0GBX9_9APHY
MADKRKRDDRDKPRRRFRPDGTPVWGSQALNGPGVWVTCIKGKEKNTVGELYDVFESLAAELWPLDTSEPAETNNKEASEDEDEDGDIEKQIAKEVASMKRPKKEQRFANGHTNTPCVVFISCKPPVDPVQLVVKYVENVMETGVSQTRYTQRLTPVSAACPTNLPEIRSLCTRLLTPFLEEYTDKSFTYKIELRTRNHNSLSKEEIVQAVAKCVPGMHKVKLENPEVYILIEIFKSVCGVSIVKDYYRKHKFNVMEISNAKNEEIGFSTGEGTRLTEKE